SLAPSTQIQFMNNQSKKCLSEQHCAIWRAFSSLMGLGVAGGYQPLSASHNGEALQGQAGFWRWRGISP
ncbi:hypothetical protein, partial [Aeromonas caviae]